MEHPMPTTWGFHKAKMEPKPLLWRFVHRRFWGQGAIKILLSKRRIPQFDFLEFKVPLLLYYYEVYDVSWKQNSCFCKIASQSQNSQNCRKLESPLTSNHCSRNVSMCSNKDPPTLSDGWMSGSTRSNKELMSNFNLELRIFQQ